MASTVLAAALAPVAQARTDVRELDERFSAHLASRHFEMWSEAEVPIRQLIGVAEDTRDRTRAWLGLEDDDETVTANGELDRTRIYFVTSTASLHAIEARHGLTPERHAHRDRSFRGRCYAELGLIVILIGAESGLRWQVAHEVTHTVFHEIVGLNVEIVNEGLAELLPYWILRTEVGTPELLDAQYALYDRRVAQAVLARELPSFDVFVRVDTDRFYDPRARWLWYALSWKLAKVLVENPDPKNRGRYRRFLDQLGRGNAVWPSLRAVYDVDAVETAWRDEIDRSAAWRPLFGDWTIEPNAIVGSVTGPHSACATLSPLLPVGEPFDLALTLDGSPAPDLAFGFVFDARGEADFVYVEFRPGCESVTIAERADGRWLRVDEYSVAPRARPIFDSLNSSRRIALHADVDGHLDLRVDGESVVSCELGRELAGGALGVMFERCDPKTPAGERSEVRFRDVQVLR